MRVFDVEGQPLNLNGTQSVAVPETSSNVPPKASPARWQPSRGAIIGTVAGILVVLVLTVGLVFGLNSKNSNGSPSAVAALADVPESCRDLILGNFWQSLAPTNYNISLNLGKELFGPVVDPKQELRFSATTAVSFAVAQSAGCVVLHSKNLVYNNIQLINGDDAVSICADATECEEAVVAFLRSDPPINSFDTDLLAIDLKGAKLQPNQPAVLKFTYTGVVGPDPYAKGLHRSAPFASCDAGGTACQERYLVTNQLERTGARQVFPCYDGPSHKAVFEMTVTAPVDEAPVVLSNTEEASSTESDDGTAKTVVFKPTPKMSTYLVAITVGELEEAVAGTGGTSTGGDRRRRLAQTAATGTAAEVRAWAVPGRSVMMKDALTLGQAALKYFTDYFDYAQPMAKFDMVAIPGKPGAMENWGLLLFDEPRILYNAISSGAYGRVQLASVICHEFGHQWIGNLATAPNWEQLLMKEGLVSAHEYECMQAIAPEVSSMVMQFRIVPPNRERGSPHDGILSNGLRIGGDPLMPSPIVDSDFIFDKDPSTESQTYSKGGSFFFLLRQFVQLALSPLRDDVWQYIMNSILTSRQYDTLSFYEFMMGIGDAVAKDAEAKIGPGKQFETYPWADILLERINLFAPANNDPELAREYGSNGTATLASWAYSTGMPFFPPIDMSTVDPNNGTMAGLTIGATQKRYCNWYIDEKQGKELGFSQDIMKRIDSTCNSPVRFSTLLHMDNLTDCDFAADVSEYSTQSGPVDRGNIAANHWVMNTNGERLWRTQYSQEHFDTLVKVTKDMVACSDDVDITGREGSDKLCCAGAGDAIEVVALTSDAMLFSLRQIYPADWSMVIAEVAAAAPAASSGFGHYLLLLPAVEAAEYFEPAMFDNKTCYAQLEEFRASLLSRHVEEILAGAMKTTSASSGIVTAATGDEARVDILRRLAISPLLRRAALVNGVGLPVVADAAAPAVGKRKLQQTVGEAPEEAPVDAVPPTTAAVPAAEQAGVSLQTRLCEMLPSTPLWANFVDSDGSSSAPATASPSADLLPAIYAVAAQMPADCEAAISSAYSSSSLAQAPGLAEPQQGIRTALIRCWLYEPIYAEASRCLHADAAFASTDLNIDKNNAPTATDSLQKRISYTVRSKELARSRGWLLFQASTDSTESWRTILDIIQQDDMWEALTPFVACEVINAMRTAVTEEEREDYKAFFNGRGRECSEDIRARSLGRMASLASAVPEGQRALCGFLDSRSNQD